MAPLRRIFGLNARAARVVGGGAAMIVALAIAPIGETGCYITAGAGQPPPINNFYFPVGLAVSKGGNVLYVANSDFDLQWNGGTVQSYDLHLIRRDALDMIVDPSRQRPQLVLPPPPPGSCPQAPPDSRTDGNGSQPPTWTCAPPTRAAYYVRDSAIIGAFATDLQVGVGGKRIFVPIRGDVSLTWVDVAIDDPNIAPPETPDAAQTYAPFKLDCGPRTEGRCDASHHAGSDPTEPGNTREVTMPGEPFGMAQSDDGSAIVVTHQTDTRSSLFAANLGNNRPALEFIADSIPGGGIAVAAVPHDADAYRECISGTPADCARVFPRPAFIQVSRSVAQMSLLRYYDDIGQTGGSSLYRPFLANEQNITINANAGSTDSRGIAFDPSARLRCKAAIGAGDVDAKISCAQLPARFFITSRSPASLIVGEVGQVRSDGVYDADAVRFRKNVPMPPGPSRIYVAPVVDAAGRYALRVFVVCSDASQIVVYDPDADQVESVVRVGPGPFALTFDPFSFSDMALRKQVPQDVREPARDLLTYRFAYVASFTQSFVQLLDFDNSRADKSTFGTVVFTLGMPTQPKGT